MSIESVMLSNHFILCHPLLLWPSIFPVSGTFSMRWLITSGGQSIGASTPTSVLPINVQSWFCLGLTDLFSMQSKRLSRVPCILDYQASTKYFLTQSTASILLIIVSPAPQFKSINSLAFSLLWIIDKAREFQENIYFCFIDYAKAFDCVDHNKLWKMLQEMGIRDHLTCLLRNLYAGQETIVRTGHGTTDWFQIGKGVCQGCILSPCLFNLHADYIMRNAGLKEAETGIKIARRNINNLRYTDDTTLMAVSEEELKSLLMKVK